jgi:hypothetical protein
MEYSFLSRVLESLSSFGKFIKVLPLLNFDQRDKLFRELTGIKKSLEVWLLLKRSKSFSAAK